jgi:hypothetical protein
MTYVVFQNMVINKDTILYIFFGFEPRLPMKSAITLLTSIYFSSVYLMKYYLQLVNHPGIKLQKHFNSVWSSKRASNLFNSV